MRRLVVVGSINMDLVNHVASFPKPGETIHGHGTEYYAGGKGANQAVAAARLGGDVSFIGAVGSDPFGSTLRDGLSTYGIDTSAVITKEGNSGLAFITVNETGENQIILSGGSNSKLQPADITSALLQDAFAVMLQNEIPWETNVHTIRLCRSLQVPVILNPAPAIQLPEEIFPWIDTLVVNETEAEVISGIEVRDVEGAYSAGALLLSKGAEHVIVTLGSKGCVYVGKDEKRFIPSFPVKPVDTTAAGDTFIGAYAAALQSGKPVQEALRFASAAAAISVTRKGAQASIPTREEVEFMLRNQGYDDK